MNAPANTVARMPLWAWAVAIGLALTQPLIHCCIRYAPPEGTTSTGLAIADDAIFLTSMDMFWSGFHSPYATCLAEGDASIHYYSVPHLWLYGLLGLLTGGSKYGDPFMALGIANGLGALAMLWAVYRVLRALAPAHADRAFLLYTLSAGIGGVLYLVAGALGMHGWPGFDAAFARFALYDLVEGPNQQPLLYYPRLYYTLSLAGLLGGFAALVHTARANRLAPQPGWFFAIAIASFLDARYAAFTFTMALIFLAQQRLLDGFRKALLAVGFAVPIACGVLPAYLLMRTNPAVVQNHLDLGSMAMWIAPFLSVAWLHIVVGWRPMRDAFRRMPPLGNWLACLAFGYCVAYAALYVLRQGYYGNLLTGNDATVAAAISDLALIGAIVGAAVAIIRPSLRSEMQPQDWLFAWFLVAFAASISGWGQGWFLRFGPQRLEVFLWLPLCVFAAIGVAQLQPRMRMLANCIFFGCGITAILVSIFAFQTPFGRTHAEGPYSKWHPEIVHGADAQLIDALGPGTVLSPAPLSDAIVRRRGNPVVFGIATFNLTTLRFLDVCGDVDAFFNPATANDVRRSLAEKWCADYVVCPGGVSNETRSALDRAAWLERIAQSDRGASYRVK